ncbi:anti-sigma factor [Sandarakinorhabdus sp. DWP1-3-1]|uniref:anti-sigma factor n=1 Tax=Sandarakinorhabdus sp. DWP1-3-1 TaxID=2804627 RepID=UPI003CF47912
MTGPADMNDALPDGMTPDAALALDFALGVLPRAEHRAAELRLLSDPDFRAAVEAWQRQLSPLDAGTPGVAPPPQVWERISADIAPAPARQPARPARRSLWDNVALWRGFAFAGVAAAAIAIAQVGPPPPAPGAPPQLLVAALAGADGTPLLSAAYDPLRGAVVLTPATQRDDKGKSAELWVIEGEKPPRSLGVIDIQGPNAHAISSKRLAGLAPGATLAVSIEPLGGSPTGQPTGPVVATGKLVPV